MASVSYPVSNITAGVSTQEYSLRMDGQASAQSNALNSPRYGLCKRPNSNYLANVEINAAWSAPLMFPLVYGGVEKLYVYGATAPMTVGCSNGTKTTMCVFPSSSNVATSSYANYDMSSATYPNNVSYVRVGDVTFIAHSAKQPAMKTTTWLGYNSDKFEADGSTRWETTAPEDGIDSGTTTVTNDDVWAAQLTKIELTKNSRFDLTWTETISGTTKEWYADVKTSVSNGNDVGLDNQGGTGSRASGPVLATILAYQTTVAQNDAGTPQNMHQATSLSPVSYDDATHDLSEAEQAKATAVVTGRYINQAHGSLSSMLFNNTKHSDGARLAWKIVDNITELPSRSWEDHTLKVADEEINPNGFYMRFVSDDDAPMITSNTVSGIAGNDGEMTATKRLPRSGHWEEYCGVGVLTEVDSATMPHMVVRRPDGSFAFMEARGSFPVNTSDPTLGLGVTPKLAIHIDDGFDGMGSDSTDAKPFVVGDTISFSEHATTDAATVPTQFEYETEYFVVYVERSGDDDWLIKISETKGGAPIDFTDPDGGIATCELTVNLTTYKNLKFSSRKAGDDDTNKLPDFFKNPIEGLFSYQDRLGIFTENEVTLSGTDDAFNFFRSTIRDLLDSDRLRVRPSQADNESIQQILPYKTGLIIVTNRKQLMLYGQNGALAPGTVTVVEASSAETDVYTTPVVVDDSLYLAYAAANGGGMYEMFPESQTGFAVRDVSAQIPGYLPEGPRALQASSKHSMLFWLDDGTGQNSTALEQENLYVYTWDVGGPKKQQSAWTKWEFNSNNATAATVGYKIHNIVSLGDRLYMLVESDACTIIEYIDLDITRPQTDLDDTTEAAFDGILLDRLIPRTSFTSINESSDDTVIVVPYEIPTTVNVNIDDEVVIVATDGSTTTYYTSGITIANGTGSATVTLADVDLATDTDIKVWVGFKYTMSHTLGPFSPIMGERAVRGRNVFVRGGRLTYSKLNTLAIATDATRTQTISAGGTASKSGEEFFAIHQHINDLSVTLTNDTPWQSMIQGLDYDLNVQEGMNQPVWR